VRILLGGVVVLLLLFGVGCGGESPEKDTSVETPQGTTQEKAVTVEETTAPREKTEVTTGFEFSVGKTPMDEEEDDDKVVRRREVVVEREGKSSSDTQEEQYPPESDSPDVECRFFNQAEWVQADAEQKAFIQECDRAAGRAVPSPSAKEADSKESPQERATQPEPQQQPQPAPTPLPSIPAVPDQPAVNNGADCSTGVSNVPVVPGSKGDRDGDGIACEK
jgi:hypothetical protein